MNTQTVILHASDFERSTSIVNLLIRYVYLLEPLLERIDDRIMSSMFLNIMRMYRLPARYDIVSVICRCDDSLIKINCFF